MIQLLSQLISAPSPSRQEGATAQIIYDWLRQRGASPQRIANNVWALSSHYDASLPTLLLNSHHDTVRPSQSYTRNPYVPAIEDGRLYGLGSNDAGASAVTLMQTFVNLQRERLPFNLLLAITAEEEVGGENGMRLFLPEMAKRGISIDCAIVGEPTGMDAAVAERGLVVLDCVTQGVAGHVARNEGVNAIYLAMRDISAVRSAPFPAQSAVLGPVGVNVTQIASGSQHNVVPDSCQWVIDMRTTDACTNEQAVAILQEAAKHSVLTPRSTRVRASVIDEKHPLVRSAITAGAKTFVSPTTSDMSLMPFPSLKIGPGHSSRSHKADEYVLIAEIEQAANIYDKLIRSLDLNYKI